MGRPPSHLGRPKEGSELEEKMDRLKLVCTDAVLLVTVGLFQYLQCIFISPKLTFMVQCIPASFNLRYWQIENSFTTHGSQWQSTLCIKKPALWQLWWYASGFSYKGGAYLCSHNRGALVLGHNFDRMSAKGSTEPPPYIFCSCNLYSTLWRLPCWRWCAPVCVYQLHFPLLISS